MILEGPWQKATMFNNKDQPGVGQSIRVLNISTKSTFSRIHRFVL